MHDVVPWFCLLNNKAEMDTTVNAFPCECLEQSCIFKEMKIVVSFKTKVIF